MKERNFKIAYFLKLYAYYICPPTRMNEIEEHRTISSWFIEHDVRLSDTFIFNINFFSKLFVIWILKLRLNWKIDGIMTLLKFRDIVILVFTKIISVFVINDC